MKLVRCIPEWPGREPVELFETKRFHRLPTLGTQAWQVGPGGQTDTLHHQAAHPGTHSEDRGKPRDLTV